MMILAAVLLVIGLIALAGMVARVNQLGSQTAVESNQPILGELPPLADAIEDGVAELLDGRTVASVTGTAGNPTLTGPSVAGGAGFRSTDVGQAVTGPGIPLAARVLTYAELGGFTTVTLSAAPPGAVSGNVVVGRFALSTSTTPTLEDGIVAMLEQLQRVEAGHGFIMDYELTCTGVTNRLTGAGGNTAQGIVIAHLSDGTVWAEVQTSAASYFARTSCASVYG